MRPPKSVNCLCSTHTHTQKQVRLMWMPGQGYVFDSGHETYKVQQLESQLLVVGRVSWLAGSLDKHHHSSVAGNYLYFWSASANQKVRTLIHPPDSNNPASHRRTRLPPLHLLALDLQPLHGRTGHTFLQLHVAEHFPVALARPHSLIEMNCSVIIAKGGVPPPNTI